MSFQPPVDMVNQQASDVFFELIPQIDSTAAQYACGLPHNKPYIGAPLLRDVTPCSRQSTPSIEAGEPDYMTPLRVIFKDLMKTDLSHGIQLGSDPKCCMIQIGLVKHTISKRQCHLLVDDQLRVSKYDSDSRNGIAMVIGEQDFEPEARRNGEWLLTDIPGRRTDFAELVLVCRGTKFGLKFPNHVRGTPDYCAKMHDLYHKQQRDRHDAMNLVESVTADKTKAITGQASPRQGDTYHKISKLGQGAFGVVFEVRRGRDGAVFAMKTQKTLVKFSEQLGVRQGAKRKAISTTEMKDLEDEWQDWKYEYDLMAKCSHANILKVIDFLSNNDNTEARIVMDIYRVGSLADCDLSDAGITSAAAQILDGLEFLHKKKLVHRDLKPANFLLVRDPFKVVIADFDLAKVMNPRLTSVKGTDLYWSPALFQIPRGYGWEVDIYSLGVILLQWIYGLPSAPPDSVVVPYSVRVAEKRQNKNWYDTLHQYVTFELGSGGLFQDLITRMIDYEAENKISASDCLQDCYENQLIVRRKEDDLLMCRDWQTRDQFLYLDDDNNGTVPLSGRDSRATASRTRTVSNLDRDVLPGRRRH